MGVCGVLSVPEEGGRVALNDPAAGDDGERGPARYEVVDTGSDMGYRGPIEHRKCRQEPERPEFRTGNEISNR